MMTNRKLNLHYLGLTFFISLAIILRFWNLELKPLWMDEVITAIFSLGKNYHSIPLDVVFPLEKLRDIFSYQPGVSCPQIAQNLATDSTHPPLFFCGMYTLLGLVTPLGDVVVNKLRSPSVWFGVALVVTVYFLNRIAFSRKAGLMGAAFVAVSPFAVYLSQEARHYTLPMLTISLSLLALLQIQQDFFQSQQVRVWLWLSWTIIHSISIYIHYFCIIAFIAQVGTLILLKTLPISTNTKLTKNATPHSNTGFDRSKISPQKIKFHNVGTFLLALILSTTVVIITIIPWFWVMQNHLNRSETSWLPTPQHIEPLYQTLMSWVVMIIMLPVEGQPLAIAIISGLLMLLFTGWLSLKVIQGIKLLLQESTTRLSTLTLLSFTTLVLLGILTISYILGKDITVAPRYNFIYYPSFSALIAASLIRENSSESILLPNNSPRGEDTRTTKSQKSDILKLKIQNYSPEIILLVGFISCIFVVYNLSFQKPYLPEQVARNIYQESNVPIMAVMAYKNYQDVALGLSYALALSRETKALKDETNNIPAYNYSKFAFFNQTSGFQSVFETLSQLPNQNISQLNLWIFAPGRLRRDYPEKINVSQSLSCNIDINQHYRIGIPYQLYRCRK
jgi:uncharacterized membrane protein